MKISTTFIITVAILAIIFLGTAVMGLDVCWEWTKVAQDHFDTQVISTIYYYKGYAKGKKAAKEEIVNQRVMMYVHGHLMNPSSLNASNGFLERPVAGCITSPFAWGCAEGHNRYITKYFSNHPLPEYSFLNRGDELKEPKKFLDRQTENHSPLNITIDSPPVVSSDGKYTLDLKDGYFYIFSENIVYRTFPKFENSEIVQFEWGQSGQDIVFVKWIKTTLMCPTELLYGSLDLRTGQWLVVEECCSTDCQENGNG